MRVPKRHQCKGTRRWDHTFPSGYTTHGYDLDAECVPGVTTVLGILDKPALPWWYGKQAGTVAVDDPSWLVMGRDEAIKWLAGAGNRTKNKAALLGTKLHEYADALHKTGEAPGGVDPEVIPFVASLAHWVDEWRPTTLLSEFAVGHRGVRYMGTGDQVIDCAGVGRILIDLKTGGDEPGKVYPEFGLQLAALRYAEFRLTAFEGGAEEPMPPVDGCAILHVRPDFYELVPYEVTADDLDAFAACRQVWEWKQGHSDVLPALPSPTEPTLLEQLEASLP